MGAHRSGALFRLTEPLAAVAHAVAGLVGAGFRLLLLSLLALLLIGCLRILRHQNHLFSIGSRLVWTGLRTIMQ